MELSPRAWRWLNLPPVRIVVAFLWVGVVGNVGKAAVRLLSRMVHPTGTNARLFFEFLEVAAIITTMQLAYSLYVRWYERRPMFELSRHRAAGEVAVGVLLGCVLFCVTIGTLASMGCFRVLGLNDWTAPAWVFMASVGAGYGEELLIRGILFRITEEGLGTWPALVISSAVFGAAHAASPHATITSMTAVALEAGLLLGIAYALTRRLWLPMGLHFAWNFTQAGIFGATASGYSMKGLLRSDLHGPTLLSGGEFGAEASVVAVVVCLAATCVLGVLAWRRGRLFARGRDVAALRGAPVGAAQSQPAP